MQIDYYRVIFLFEHLNFFIMPVFVSQLEVNFFIMPVFVSQLEVHC